MIKTSHWCPWAICLVACWLLVGIARPARAQYEIGTIPSPKERGQGYYVSNPDRILSAGVVDSLNRLAHIVDGKTSAELAVAPEDVGDCSWLSAPTRCEEQLDILVYLHP